MVFDIITIGDTTTDIFLGINEKSPLSTVNKEKTELRLKYASKIPVKNVHRIISGGNAANHAVGAARLGLKTAIYTIVGNDDAGEAIENKMKKEKVFTNYIKEDKKDGTNLAVVMDYTGDRTILSYHADRTYSLPKFGKTKWIYFSSICGNHAEFNRELSEYVKTKKIKLGFNPGSVQMKLGMAKLKPILSVTEVVFVNKQEAERLTNKKGNIKTLLEEMKKTGPKIVVITDGKKGSYCYDGGNMYHLGTVDMPMIENTGCGDAYASGFVAALINGNTITEAMRWGGVNAANVATKIGSQAGLSRKTELKKLLDDHEYLQPKVL